MNRHILVALFAALFLATIALTAAAQGTAGVPASSPAAKETMAQPSPSPGEFVGKGHSRHSLEAILKKLGITDEQRKQIRALYTTFKDKTRKARTDLMTLKDEKQTMLMSGKVDQQKLAQIDDQIVKLRGDVMREGLKLQRDRLALMTPEQIEKIAQWRADKAFKAKFRRHFGKMHWGGHRGHFEG
jgi:protein CpxP